MPVIEPGMRFGRLTVTGKSPRSRPRRAWWDCVCDCGNRASPRADGLRNGTSQSCGCIQREWVSSLGSQKKKHGRTETREYETWQRMLQRCFNENSLDYPDYGGRGITVCERWRDSFSNFFEDMGERPPLLTLERLDVHGDYCPENCAWATQTEQSRNRRHSIYVRTPEGTIALGEYAQRNSLRYKVAYSLFRRGKLDACRPNSE